MQGEARACATGLKRRAGLHVTRRDVVQHNDVGAHILVAVDLLDYKPELQKHDGKDCPDEYLKGKRFAFTSGVPKLLGTRQPFKKREHNARLSSRAPDEGGQR